MRAHARPASSSHATLTRREAVGILLKQAKVSADDGSWRAKLVSNEGQGVV